MPNISLEQIASSAAAITTAKIEVIREDYDDYGSECYVKIVGECANIRIEKTDIGFDCSLNCHRKEDLSSSFEYAHPGVRGGVTTAHHRYSFRTKEVISDVCLTSVLSIEKWLEDHVKYLKATSDLFERIDEINYPDLRGEEKYGNGLTSYDRFLVCDEDFYTDEKIKETRRTKLHSEPPAATFSEALENWY